MDTSRALKTLLRLIVLSVVAATGGLGLAASPASAAITNVSILSVTPSGSVLCPATLTAAVQVQGTPNEPFIWIGVYSLGGVMGNTGSMPYNGKIGPSGTASFNFALPIRSSATGPNSWIEINTQTTDVLMNYNSMHYALNVTCASASALAKPVNLHAVTTSSDCQKYAIPSSECENAFVSGHLTLAWDENGSATSYTLLRTDAPNLNPYAMTKGRFVDLPQVPPGSGFGGQCFAVTAQTTAGVSPPSATYCYAPGASATTRTFTPVETATAVQGYASEEVSGCSGYAPSYFSTMDRLYGDAFTQWFPLLATGRGGQYVPTFVQPGLYAGAEQAAYVNEPSCGAGVIKGTGSSLNVGQVTFAAAAATGAIVFDLSPIASHHVVSATLYFAKTQNLAFSSTPAFGFPGGKFLIAPTIAASGPLGSCSFALGTAPEPPGNSPPIGGFVNTAIPGDLVRGIDSTASFDVTSVVAPTASHAKATFVINAGPTAHWNGPNTVTQTGGCLAEFASPQLSVTSF